MATMKDVAKRAGVSVATVSCCLSGAKGVKPETKLRVMQAIEDLCYVPNAAARNLKKSGSKKIGIVLPDLNDLFCAELLKGITTVLQDAGYLASILFSYKNSKLECERIDALFNDNVAGILLLTCQPENTRFFQERIYRYGMPCVFMHNQPKDLNADYAGIDNRRTSRHITSQLLRAGYRDLSVIMGPMRFSAEEDFFLGVRDAFADAGLTLPEEQVYITNLTKENAFQATMEACHGYVPHAILSTSGQMTKGIREALDIIGVRIPEDTFVFTLGEESWNRSEHLPGILYSARSADVLGASAARQLLARVECPHLPPQALIQTDHLLERKLEIPPRRCPVEAERIRVPQQTLRVMFVPMPSSHALELLSAHCINQAGIALKCEYVQANEALDVIREDMTRAQPRFDLYQYDTPWTTELAASGALMELTEMVQSGQIPQYRIPQKNWANARADGRIFGVPLLNGAQLLFYRQDLFENPAVIQAYRARYNASLRPPRSWAEYNRIAAFFTRAVNPDSPTEFGTSISANSCEWLAPELMPRVWSFGGRLWNDRPWPCLCTPQNVRAFSSILETFRYCCDDPFTLTADEETTAFCAGKQAMIISFSEYARAIRDALNEQKINGIGYAPTPGPGMCAGWNLAVNRHADSACVGRFFRWLMEDQTSYYYTILGGQATTQMPYTNSEIIGLYPWMEQVWRDETRRYARVSPPLVPGSCLIPVNEIEKILSHVLYLTYENGIPLHDAMAQGQAQMEQLFAAHGYTPA